MRSTQKPPSKTNECILFSSGNSQGQIICWHTKAALINKTEINQVPAIHSEIRDWKSTIRQMEKTPNIRRLKHTLLESTHWPTKKKSKGK